MSKKAENRIGIEFTTNEGYQVVVIDYVSNKQVQVMFLDDYKYTMWTKWTVLKNGELKNPFHKSIYEVGYLGVMENGERPKPNKFRREYEVWHCMMDRCYSNKELHKTYKNVTVCKEWHSFSQFLKDMPKIKGYDYWKDNPNERVALNKDTYYAELGINTDCKEYNLLTTRFLTISDNAKEVAKRMRDTKQRDELGRFTKK